MSGDFHIVRDVEPENDFMRTPRNPKSPGLGAACRHIPACEFYDEEVMKLMDAEGIDISASRGPLLLKNRVARPAGWPIIA